MTPAALGKADDLYRFVQHEGAGADGMELLLTLGEGYELLDWLPTSGMVSQAYMHVLLEDIANAEAQGDPWLVLENFQLNGFKITRSDRVLQ